LPKTGGPRPLHGQLKAGKTIVYVLDRSASMGIDGVLPRAIASLRASLDQLGPDSRFQIVAYNGGTMTFVPQPVVATPDAIGQAGRWLSGLIAEGGSNHVRGFREALAARPDVVFLLTDADDLEASDVRTIAALNRKPARVLAAVFGGIRPAHETPLERLATLTGGSIQYVGP
jgi:Ca-activated chloride channel family protein